MPHSAMWDKTSPLGSDLANLIDNFMRDEKRDIEERMQVDHIWAVDLVNDGKHKSVTMIAQDDVTPFTTPVANTLTGATTGGLFDLSQTWNTTGVGHAFMVDIVNTASHADSDLINMKVNGVTVFRVGMNGLITVGGISGPGGGTGDVIAPGGVFPIDEAILRTDGAGTKAIQASTVLLSDSGSIVNIDGIQWRYSSNFSWNTAKVFNTNYLAATDGFVFVMINTTAAAPNNGYVRIMMDTFSPPTTVRGGLSVFHGTINSTMWPVKYGEYWKVIAVAATGSPVFTLRWVPMGLAG